jgi:hypothetical protein
VKKSLLFLWAGVLALSAAGATQAVTFTEVGDAGELVATAWGTGTGIDTTRGLVDHEADLFALVLPAGPFTAWTYPYDGPAAGNNFDPQLFLFDSNGFGIIANDDWPGSSRSQINTTLSAGLYYIGIPVYDYDPISVGGMIFPNFPRDMQFGATGPGGAAPLSDWQGSASGGNYTLRISPSSLPESTTLILFASGLAGLVALRRRSKS